MHVCDYTFMQRIIYLSDKERLQHIRDLRVERANGEAAHAHLGIVLDAQQTHHLVSGSKND